jgi:DNA-binding response OmpR family regulator
MSTPPKDQKVLVIIDDPQINYLLERVLQSAGFLVETVHSEEAALQYLQASNPAVIILSDAMGEANGVDIVCPCQ